MSDTTFEKTFGDLAHAHLTDRAPGLLDYLVGFQVIDKTDDETRGVAIFGFQVGKQWMYAPVFFLNGEIKGQELLYIKAQDSFVPLQENWVNYLISRKPDILGESAPMAQSRKGMKTPDFDIFSDSPLTAYKSAGVKRDHSFKAIYENTDDDLKDALEIFTVSPTSEKFAGVSEKFDILSTTKRLGRSSTEKLARAMRGNEKFAEAVLQFYSIHDILDATAPKATTNKALDGLFKSAEELEASDPAPKGAGGFTVIYNKDDVAAKGLSDNEKYILKRDGVYILDERKNTSTVFNTDVNLSLSGPDRPGVYQLVTRSGEMKPVYVFYQSKESADIGNRKGQKVTVVEQNSKEYGVFYGRDILVRTDTGTDSRVGWKETFNGLGAAKSPKRKDTVVFVNESMAASVPFTITNKIMGDGGTITFDVTPDYSAEEINEYTEVGRLSCHPFEYDKKRIDKVVITGRDGTKLVRDHKTLYVPNQFKVLKLKRTSGDDGYTDYVESYNRTPLEPSSQQDLHQNLLKQGNLTPIKINTDGIEYWITVDNNPPLPLTKTAAMVKLAREFNIKADLAKHMVKSATNGGRSGQAKFLLKIAATAPTLPEPPMGFDPELGVLAQEEFQEDVDVDSMKPDSNAAGEYNTPDFPQESQQQAIQAANTGQKEVLDTAVLTGLVNTAGTDRTVDSYMGDLTVGLDRIGRILFMFYWHNDKFKERYGKQDMPELEDTLRDVFKSMGDMVLFLKKKTIEPDPQSAASEVDLNEVV